MYRLVFSCLPFIKQVYPRLLNTSCVVLLVDLIVEGPNLAKLFRLLMLISYLTCIFNNILLCVVLIVYYSFTEYQHKFRFNILYKTFMDFDICKVRNLG